MINETLQSERETRDWKGWMFFVSYPNPTGSWNLPLATPSASSIKHLQVTFYKLVIRVKLTKSLVSSAAVKTSYPTFVSLST